MRLICRGLGKSLWRGRAVLALALLAAIAAITLRLGTPTPQLTTSGNVVPNPFLAGPKSENQSLHLAYGQLPLIFEPNQGQSDSQVKFLAHGAGYGLFLTADEAVLALGASVGASKSREGFSVLRMQMVGANPSPSVIGNSPLPGHSNYFIGNDPSRWHRDIPQFSRVRYAQVYPGIDLVYYGNRGLLEYDFELAPGADPRRINLHFEGSERLTLQNDGNLLLHLRGGDVRLLAPRVYQEIAGQQQPIRGRFVQRGRQEVGFELGAYDPSRVLVIDPVLAYSSYLGGNLDEACSVITATNLPTPGCPGVAVDSASSIYLAGTTTSTNFPLTPGPYNNPPFAPFQSTLAGTSNLFVTKIDSTGSTILFSTYLGGDKVDLSAGIAVDSGLDVIVTGSTTSDNFPATPNAFQTAPFSAGRHVFVSQLDPNGHTLLYSTYLSGNGQESASGVAVDFRSKIYVLGTTTSNESCSAIPNPTGPPVCTNPPSGTTFFPATLAGFQKCNTTVDVPPAAGNCGTNRFFLTLIDPVQSGSNSLRSSTYFAGDTYTPPTDKTVGGGITTDAAGNVYITGGTNYQRTGNTSSDFPILNAYQGCLNTPPPNPGVTQTCTNTAANTDAFVAKFNLFNSSGAQLLYSTYLGGSGDDVGYGIAVDTGFSAYVTGSTTSTDFIIPTGTVPFQNVSGGGTDAFLGRFGNPCTGSTCSDLTVPLNYFSYLGGTGSDVGMAVAIDSTQSAIGGARIAGYTNSTDFPLNPITGTPIIQSANRGLSDAFVSRIDTTANSATDPGNYGTYLGGGGNDYGTAIATDNQGNTYVAGETASGNFPTKNPLPPNGGGLQGNTDAFIAKLAPLANLIFPTVPGVSPFPVGVGNPVSFEFEIMNNGDFVQSFTVVDFLPSTGATFNSASASPGTCTNTVINLTVQCVVGPLNAGQTAEVTVTVNPTAPNPPSTTTMEINDNLVLLGNNLSRSAVARVNDYNLSLSPSSPPPVVAGAPATVNATVTPTGNIPESVSLACSAGLPTGATCSFPNGSSIPNLSSGPQSRQLVINTIARVTTPASLWRRGVTFYAACLPVLGFALLGVGIVGSNGSRRRGILAVLLTGCFSMVLFQSACGSSSTTSTTTGTPAGTYSITITATSGSAPGQAVRSQLFTLTVQ